MDKEKNYGFSTRAIHVGEEPAFGQGQCGNVVAPIHLSTTFARQQIDEPTGGYEYTRSNNPTRAALEKKYASLEQANFALAFGSGVAACNTVFLALLKNGGHIIAGNDLYGGTIRSINRVMADFHVSCDYIDLMHPETIANYIKPETRMVFIESPTNPLLNVYDIKAIAGICKKHNLLLVVDNTFLTPYFQNPLLLGADVVIHSVTKYIGGHSDVLGGAVMVNDESLYKILKFHQNAVGAVPSPFDCYLTIRGIKTLKLRMEKHQENAQKLAGWLEQHPKISKVIYPGLESHPGKKLMEQQASGFGAMITFEIKGGYTEASEFLSRLKIIALAESLGGVESLIEHPAKMTHASLTPEMRKAIGISDSLIRFSVGIEDYADLKADLEFALG